MTKVFGKFTIINNPQTKTPQSCKRRMAPLFVKANHSIDETRKSPVLKQHKIIRTIYIKGNKKKYEYCAEIIYHLLIMTA